MKNIIFMTIIIITVFAYQVSSEELTLVYAGLDISRLKYSEDNVSCQYNPISLIGVFGYSLNNNISIEGRMGIGLSDDDESLYGYEMNYKMESLVGVYVSGKLNIYKDISVYSLFGFSRIATNLTSNNYSVVNSHDDFSYGVGFDYKIINKTHLKVEYISYLSESYYDLSALNIGFIRYF